jgi:hypothetical protein
MYVKPDFYLLRRSIHDALDDNEGPVTGDPIRPGPCRVEFANQDSSATTLRPLPL